MRTRRFIPFRTIAVRLRLIACASLLLLLLTGCRWMAAWLYPVMPDTFGTWSGVVNIESLACNMPKAATADAMVLHITDGPPIKTVITGTPPRTQHTLAAGAKVVVVDRASARLLMRPDLAGKLVRVHGVVTSKQTAIDPISGLGMVRYAKRPNEYPVLLLKVISTNSLKVIK